MASLEDKILGEKLHNYCSSSEESDGNDSDSEKPAAVKDEAASLPDPEKWEGTSTNTGPKGVIKDWQRYKQLEIAKREEDERERIAIMKKLTLSVQSALDEEREKAIKDDPDLVELLDDEYVLEYQKRRMQELLQQHDHKQRFGHVIHLQSGTDFLNAIDKEHKAVTVVIHIYEDNNDACRLMNSCLNDLSKAYEKMKFCAIIGSRAGISKKFKVDGVPALLVYKDGHLIGNFVRMTDDLGNDFCTEDVQSFLVEHGVLEDKTCTPFIVKQGDNDESD